MDVAVGNARLWVEDDGDGPPLLFLHGGLGDSRLWEPVAALLRDAFRCIRFDFRYFGRSHGPGKPFSFAADAVGVLDALDVQRAALVGLSMGGRVALEVAALHPERVRAVVHVAGAVGPLELDPELESAYDAASTPEEEMLVDFRVWAPLGVAPTYRELWQATPQELPPGAEPLPRPELRLDELEPPVYVILAAHDPSQFRAAAERIPAVARVEIDSDHYLTLRSPDDVATHIRSFLSAS